LKKNGYNLETVPLGSGPFGTMIKEIRVLDSLEACLKISVNALNENDREFLELEAETLHKIFHPNFIRIVESLSF
jgi:hypothetical protein